MKKTSMDQSHRHRDHCMETDEFLLTIFLRDDQTRNLEETDRLLKKNGFWEHFPPPGIEVVSWYVMMGIGQVVILKVPAARLREVNLAVENHAWGAYHTEFYPTYDLTEIWPQLRDRAITHSENHDPESKD